MFSLTASHGCWGIAAGFLYHSARSQVFPDGFIIVKRGIFVKYGNHVEVISKKYVC